MYFETKVTYNGIQPNGTARKITEVYLVDALSFTEAEARIISERSPFIDGDFTVSAVKKTRIAEIAFSDTADRSYLVKVGFITIDAKTAVEKRTTSLILVQADSFDDALCAFRSMMEGTVADYEIVSVAETPILEVYKAEGQTQDAL